MIQGFSFITTVMLALNILLVRSHAPDTGLVEVVEDVEEGLEQAEDDGIALEPFNLEQERLEGHFDEGGHYVENSAADEDTDAWLSSDGELTE